jgi:hypothetical protein
MVYKESHILMIKYIDSRAALTDALQERLVNQVFSASAEATADK